MSRSVSLPVRLGHDRSGFLSPAVSISGFAATGYFHCKRCYHPWQPGTEDDGFNEDAITGSLRCPKCGHFFVKWNQPLPQ